ncbi:hypothetical protein SAMN06298216_1392 [Spirosomataceae bacterium TFI 002]|nr:hypothetical protein SAMN06298216_1392 [Spirosomataceae bacterium TFI 002]
MKKITYTVSTAAKPIGEHTMYEPMPDRNWEQFDPFLLLHHHGPHKFEPYNQGLPFGPHPHRGFETLTLIYKGEIEHADSQGFKSVIGEGGIQWMTAGRGIVHSENITAPLRENGGEMEIIQLWMNLPAAKKMTPAHYVGKQKDEIPVVQSSDGKIATQVVSGNHSGKQGAVTSITDLTILNVSGKEGGVETFQLHEGDTVVLYLLSGTLQVGEKKLTPNSMAMLSKEESELSIESLSDTRFLIASGTPYNEEIVAQGPFVMNSTTEIMEAMRDYQMGKMGVM